MNRSKRGSRRPRAPPPAGFFFALAARAEYFGPPPARFRRDLCNRPSCFELLDVILPSITGCAVPHATQRLTPLASRSLSADAALDEVCEPSCLVVEKHGQNGRRE